MWADRDETAPPKLVVLRVGKGLHRVTPWGVRNSVSDDTNLRLSEARDASLLIAARLFDHRRPSPLR
jgi:hypothetical protein